MGRPKSRTCKIEWKPSTKDSKIGSIVISYVNNRYGTGVTGIRKSHLTRENLLNNLCGKDETETYRCLNQLILEKKKEIENIIDEAIKAGIDDIKGYISHFYNRKKDEGAKKLRL
jgi:inorganic pyrophosphatase/exopolyphosphatase